MKTKKHLLRRLPHYSAAAAAAAVSSAHGSVVFFDNTHSFTVTVQPMHPSTVTHNWDIDGNTTTEFQVQAYQSSSTFHRVKAIRQNGAKLLAVRTFSNHYQTASIKALAPGFVIGSHPASGAFQFNSVLAFTSANVPQGNLLTGNQYVGFQFQISGFTHYGWAEVNIQPQSIKIKEWAYESTAGASIMVPVPEPAGAPVGLGLLALGAAGVSAYRKRKLVK